MSTSSKNLCERVAEKFKTLLEKSVSFSELIQDYRQSAENKKEAWLLRKEIERRVKYLFAIVGNEKMERFIDMSVLNDFEKQEAFFKEVIDGKRVFIKKIEFSDDVPTAVKKAIENVDLKGVLDLVVLPSLSLFKQRYDSIEKIVEKDGFPEFITAGLIKNRQGEIFRLSTMYKSINWNTFSLRLSLNVVQEEKGKAKIYVSMKVNNDRPGPMNVNRPCDVCRGKGCWSCNYGNY